MMNREGLTWEEWRATATGGRAVSGVLALAMLGGWRAGEDPTDWRAALERRGEI